MRRKKHQVGRATTTQAWMICGGKEILCFVDLMKKMKMVSNFYRGPGNCLGQYTKYLNNEMIHYCDALMQWQRWQITRHHQKSNAPLHHHRKTSNT
mmetsp:Transcript_46215/g.98044  ORF Transcript_46215/g.98044 Transcript_46215/m.98044 type:complete len:96 (-) Transcript_46215:183-470(-)